MPSEHRRPRTSRRGRSRSAGFVVGFLTGGVIGVGLGVLFAPKSGAQLRRQIAEQASVLVPRQSGAGDAGDDDPALIAAEGPGRLDGLERNRHDALDGGGLSEPRRPDHHVS